MKHPLRLIILLSFCLSADATYALSLNDVLQASRTHVPQIQKSLAEVAEKQAQIQEAQGAFDWELNATSSNRLGIYDGRYVDTRITRRMSDSNARIYAGYRTSDGDLPIYEDYYNTATGGEFNIGVAFALLRDRIIDEERFRFRDAVLAQKQQEAEAHLTLLRTQYEAMVAYARWLADGHALEVMEELAALANKRQEAMQSQASAGDIARIQLTENEQNIARRQAQVADARRRFLNSCIQLSLFYRDQNGDPVVPNVKALPALLSEKPQFTLTDEALMERIQKVQNLRPEQIAIDFSQQRERNRLLLGDNARLPKLDVALEAAQNFGNDAASDAGEEGRVLLQLSIPLQQNTGDGRVRASQARLQALELERRRLNDQIAADIRAIAASASQTMEEMSHAQTEVKTAISMREAETQRFQEGATDFFVLNLREERLAEARLRLINAQRVWLENLARYYFMTLDEARLLPSDMDEISSLFLSREALAAAANGNASI